MEAGGPCTEKSGDLSKEIKRKEDNEEPLQRIVSDGAYSAGVNQFNK